MSALRIVLSTGIGRLHLVQSAVWLRRAGADIRVIQGWLPLLPDRALQAVGRWIRHPGLVYGMRQRRPPDLEGRLQSCAFAEFLHQALARGVRLLRLGRSWHWRMARLSWQVFGLQSRRHLRAAEIFHVRSGAGQGGAIRCAKRRGMRVLVDHSLAHPQFMDGLLREEYRRHGERFEMGMDSPFWRMVLLDCDQADLLLVNSDFVRDTFVAAGYDPARIRVVYLGVRRDFMGLRQAASGLPARPAAQPFRLLFTGGFGYRKGAACLLEALRMLVERGVQARLTVVGHAGEAAPLLSAYAKYRLPIELVGHVPQDTLKGHLQQADLYVFPSLAEGCASSAMEALAAGLCVVATRESGLPITDGLTGLIVPPADPAALADRVQWALGHPEETAAVGQAAARMIGATYTWEAYAGRVQAIYRELLEHGR